MLAKGIYEEIINHQLKKELSHLTDYDIHKEKLDVEEARKMLATYISSVTRKALALQPLISVLRICLILL